MLADGESVLQRRIRALSSRAEFAIVVLGAFGYLILVSVAWLFVPPGTRPVTSSGLEQLVVYELVVLVVLATFLRVRGWNAHRIGLSVGFRETVAGLKLALVSYTAYWLLTYLMWFVLRASGRDPSTLHYDPLVAPSISLQAIALGSIVNPIFEEVFVAGFIITALKERNGFWAAVLVSTAIRSLYHTYQGGYAVLGLAPLGLIFAYSYARNGRLWPLIVAHAIFDAAALLWYSQR